jgi:AcrR family transcriptional regulator
MASPHPTKRYRKSHLSRAHIRDAALLCLVEEGYARASSLAIQRRAGVSRDGLLRRYPSRSELLAAAMYEHEMSQIAAALGAAAAIEEADGSAERVDAAVDAIWANFRALYFCADAELWIAAARDHDLRELIEPGARQVNRGVRDAVACMFGPTHARHPGFGPLRDMLLTSMRGLAVADVFDGVAERHDRHVAGWRRWPVVFCAPRPQPQRRRPDRDVRCTEGA